MCAKRKPLDLAWELSTGRVLMFVAALAVGGCVTNTAAVTQKSHYALGGVVPAISPTGGFDGMASFYSEGEHVASGARFEPNALTAAHRTLPFGTRIRVSDPSTRRSVVVVINDRGPFVPGRVLDLSVGAARALGIEARGVSRIHADVLKL
jgi:rare lipoprotein A